MNISVLYDWQYRRSLQVLLVTGGEIQPKGRTILIDSTEMLVLEDTEWRTLSTARLPSPRYRIGAATIDNQVFIFGKYHHHHQTPTSNDIVNRRTGLLRDGPQHHPHLQCGTKYLGARWSDDLAKIRPCYPGHRRCGSTMPLIHPSG